MACPRAKAKEAEARAWLRSWRLYLPVTRRDGADGTFSVVLGDGTPAVELEPGVWGALPEPPADPS